MRSKLNKKHFVVTVGGQTVIATLAHDDALKRELLVFSQERDIKLRYRHRHYLVGHTRRGRRSGRASARWLAHRDRRTYEKIADPEGCAAMTTFNFWRGFGIGPKPGKWPLIGSTCSRSSVQETGAIAAG